MAIRKPLIKQLPYFQDSSTLFANIVNQPWSVFLDSGSQSNCLGRFDVLAADPVCTLVTEGKTTIITNITKPERCYQSDEDPFALITQQLLAANCYSDIVPFSGGAIGYFSYDLARRLETLPELAIDAENIPEMAVGIYDWAVIIDHQKQQSWLVGQGLVNKTIDNWQQLIAQFSTVQSVPATSVFKVTSPIKSNMSQREYAQAFYRIKDYLAEGDCYQVNLAQRFSCDCEGDPWLAYLHLRQINSAPYCSYLNTSDVQILSSSPERFLSVMDRVVETKPIKGTRSRKANPEQDQMQIQLLINSVKDRAENLMIVDLLRNDISKSCKNASVKVPKLFAVESFATVHHLVSTVRGELDANQYALDLLKSCFPGGSITGVPKIRAMEIIEELEPNRRGVYCGSIGYIGYNGNMDSNIAIRTLVHSKNTMRFWAGGGIVNDSDLDAEYQESFDKAVAMLSLLQKFQ